MNINERVGRYLAATPPAISGNHGDNQTFKVACALVHGWAIPSCCALTWLRIYNERCHPKWTLKDLIHKLESALNAAHIKPFGHLLGSDALNGSTPHEGPHELAVTPPAPQFDRDAFERFVACHAPVDANWLAERSPIWVANQTPATFLHALFYEGERVVILDKLRSQGWTWRHSGTPCNPRALDHVAKGARNGVWFLCNPVNGIYRPNAKGKWSGRSQENVTAWRYLVLESDRDDISAAQWLAFLVQLHLPIAAIYETGGRLPHALVRVDAPSKQRWDEIRDTLEPLLITFGADPSSLTAVRLTRLPCCERLGRQDEHGIYHGFDDGPHLQRLLYLNPDPKCGEAISKQKVRRQNGD
jgi:hypothetical protein